MSSSDVWSDWEHYFLQEDWEKFLEKANLRVFRNPHTPNVWDGSLENPSSGLKVYFRGKIKNKKPFGLHSIQYKYGNGPYRKINGQFVYRRISFETFEAERDRLDSNKDGVKRHEVVIILNDTDKTELHLYPGSASQFPSKK